MEHELRREISLHPAGSSQQNKKVGPRKIGTRLLYPQSVTVTSFCDTRTSDIPPPSLSATPHGRLHLMSTCSPPPQHRYQHSLYPHHKSRRKNPLPGLGVRAKITTFAHGVTPLRRPAPVREKNRPNSDSEPEFYIFPRISDT